MAAARGRWWMNRGASAAYAALAAVLLIAAALLIAGCGIGPGTGTKNASVLVTGAFGMQRIGSANERHVPGAETVMSLLERHFKVSTRYGGGFVQSIDGHSGTNARTDWFYYVNGVQAAKGAAATDVHAGDHIWWDLHDWAATDSILAVVGSYPEPFTNGLGGRVWPTLVDCITAVQSACNMVGKDLHHYGVKAAQQAFGTGSGQDSISVIVGPWRDITGVAASQFIAAGPSNSGVYAQFTGRGGSGLQLDNPLGVVTRTMHGSVGLIAATGSTQLGGTPVWLVTGTDRAGVMAAARAFNAHDLDGHFAVAVSGARVIPLPLAHAS